MKTETSGAARSWRSSHTTALAAGIAAVCMAVACSPVISEPEDVIDDPTDEVSPDEPGGDTSPGVNNGNVPKDDCSVSGTCPDPACTEPGRYRIEGDIVIDLQNSRRMWQRGYASDLDHAQATEYCAGLTLSGVTGWRLPDGAESGSIVFRAGGLKGCEAPEYCAPAIDQAAFPDTQIDLYWTSLPYDEETHLARSFCDGRSTPYKEDDTALHYARCVHDPL